MKFWQLSTLIRCSVFSFAILFSLPAGRAESTVIRDPSQLAPGFTIIDFENITTAIPTPVTISGVTFNSLTATLSLLDVSAWPANGTEVLKQALFPGGEPDSAISIVFTKPISQFLVGWGDPNFPGNVLRAYDASGNLLEEAAVELGPVGGVHAAWIGFKRPIPDISKIIVQPDQSRPSGDDYVIDNVHFSDAQPFTKMTSHFQGEIAEDANSDFQLNISFSLGQASNGINPLIEDIILSLGNLSVRFPAGSFTRNKQGLFSFRGVVDTITLNVTLKPAKTGFDFSLAATGANLAKSTLPLGVGLAVGDDAGSTTLKVVSADTE